MPIGKGLTAQSDGYAAYQPAQVAALAKVLSETIRLDSDFRIRKMTPEEFAIVWYCIASDIEEPIFVAEDKSHKFSFGFMPPEGERRFWVEDLTKPCFKLGQEDSKALTPCLSRWRKRAGGITMWISTNARSRSTAPRPSTRITTRSAGRL